MAIAFARISYHSRSHGHSAVAGAAYRAGVALFDERTGETHDFTNRTDVHYSKILLPEYVENTEYPEKLKNPKEIKKFGEQFLDREFLWNSAEHAEVRKNAQVAKDIILALPRDFDLLHCVELVTNFAQYHFVRHGVPADISIHDKGDGNPHGHVYVTTRRLLGNRFDKYKARDLEPDVVKGRVVDPQYWGEQWRDFQNRYFLEHNIDLLVDANHIITQRHEGRLRGTEIHALKAENQLRHEASVNIALNDPESLLNLLGSQYSVFGDREIYSLLLKNTDSQEEFETALLRLKSHRDFIYLGSDLSSSEDNKDRYTTRANYIREANMADHTQVMYSKRTHSVSSAILQKTLRDHNLTDEQVTALNHLADSSNVCSIVGHAGTGKSYMMRAAREMWQNANYRVYGITVSGIAAKGLETETQIPSMTIQSLKMRILYGSLSLDNNDILVLDEASMVNLHDLALIVDIANTTGTKLVLVGDHEQLQPIGAGAPFRAIIERIGFAELSQVQRQKNPTDRTASVLLSKGDIHSAIDHYASKQQVHLSHSLWPFETISQNEKNKIGEKSNDKKDDDDGSDEGGSGDGTQGVCGAITNLIMHWAKALTHDNIHNRLILAHRNIDVFHLNQAARVKMRSMGYLSDFTAIVPAMDGEIALSPGDRILFKRNNRLLGISNGEFATVLNIKNDEITVELDRDKLDQIKLNQDKNQKINKINKKTMTFSTKLYQDFDHGYAATVHKAQGVSVDHTFVYVAGRAWDRFLAYVAMTRHKKTLNIYANHQQFNNLDTLKQALSRTTFRDTVLDWPISYAIRRGFDPEGVIGRFIDKVGDIKQSVHDKWLFIVNYEAYLQKRIYQKRSQTIQNRRKIASKIALFIDLQQELSNENFDQIKATKEIKKIKETKTALRNQLGFELYQHFYQTPYQNAHQNSQACKSMLEENGIKLETLKNAAMAHEKSLEKQSKKSKQQEQEKPQKQKRQSEKSKIPITKFDLANEWSQLKALESYSVNHVIQAKERLDHATQTLSKTVCQADYESAVKLLCQQTQLMEKVKTIAPNLAHDFENITNTISKEIQINWLSEEFKSEWENLRKLDILEKPEKAKKIEKSENKGKNTDIQNLVKLYDFCCDKEKESDRKILYQQMESLAIKISTDKSIRQKFSILAPKLSQRITELVRFKSKNRGIDR